MVVDPYSFMTEWPFFRETNVFAASSRNMVLKPCLVNSHVLELHIIYIYIRKLTICISILKDLKRVTDIWQHDPHAGLSYSGSLAASVRQAVSWSLEEA